MRRIVIREDRIVPKKEWELLSFYVTGNSSTAIPTVGS